MEQTNLNLIPQKEKPIVNASQYDNGRIVRFNLFDGEDEYTLAGTETAVCNIRKVDGHVVVITPAISAVKYIDVTLTEQANACFGDQIGELVISSGDVVIGTCNFILRVEKSPMTGGVTSASDIDNLTTQITNIVVQVIGEDYYTKEEVDAIVESIPTFDPTNYYDKSDVNNLLSAKADASAVYTKGETDTLLSAKADVSDLPDMSNYYTKSETDTALSTKADAASTYNMTQVNNLLNLRLPIPQEQEVQNLPASVVTLENAGEDAPLSELTAAVTAVQAGTGTPSPSNPRSISGFSGANIVRCGVNLLDFNPVTVTTQSRIVDNFTLKAGNYVASFHIKNTTAIAGYFQIRIGSTSLGGANFGANVDGDFSRSFTLTEDSTINILVGGASSGYSYQFSNGQIELGSTASTYETYNGQIVTINFGQTVYGGVLDVTNGKLRVTHKLVTYSGEASENWQFINPSYYIASPTDCRKSQTVNSNLYNGVAPTYYNVMVNGNIALSTVLDNLLIRNDSITSVADFKTALSGTPLQVLYELATPTEITLTPTEIDTLLHDNNIYSDTGDILSMKYILAGSEDVFKYIRMIKG